MKIVSIDESGPKKRARCLVFDDGLELTVSKDVASALGFHVGFECALDRSALLALISDTSAQYGRKKAFSLLARRDYTVFEMEQKLAWDGYSKDLVGELIVHLKGLNLLNDERYIEGFAATRLQSGYGPYLIMSKLLAKGISEERARVAISQYIEAEDFDLTESARARIEKYDLTQHKDRQRAFRTLVSRGFDCDTVRKALEAI